MYKDNAFKYVSPQVALQAKKAPAIRLHPHQPVTAQTKVDKTPVHKQRVIVRQNQGDKRVAAAKSRPKKRKAVTPEDESTLSMDSIEWSSTSYNVTSLARAYAHKFPLLVKVTHGYHGDIGTQLAVGQVLQIHSTARQQRILVTDTQNRHLSLPIDYPIEVNVLQQNDRVWMKLRDVILSRSLPLRVRVMNTSHEAEAASRSIVGEDLHLQSLKEDVFLRGNSIYDGWIDQLDIAHLPCFMSAQFVVAENMRGASSEEWRDYHGMFSRSVRHLDFNLMGGYAGIYVDGAVPTLLTSSGSLRSDNDTGPSQQHLTEPTSGIYENIPSNERRKREAANIFYDNHTFSTSDEDVSKQPEVDADTVPRFIIPDTNAEIIPHFENHDKYRDGPASPSPLFIAPPEVKAKPKASTSQSSSSDYFFSGVSASPPDRKLPPKPVVPPKNQFVISPDIHSAPKQQQQQQPEVPRPETPFTDNEDLDEMFDSVIKVGQETLEKQRKEEEERALHLEREHQSRLQQEEDRLREEESRLRQERHLRAEQNRRLEQQQQAAEIKQLEKKRLQETLLQDMKGNKDGAGVAVLAGNDNNDDVMLRKQQTERERIASEALERRERDEKRRSALGSNSSRSVPKSPLLKTSLTGEIHLDVGHVEYTADGGAASRQSRSNTVTSDEVFEDKDTRRVLSILNKFEGSSSSAANTEQSRSKPVSRSGSRNGPRGSYISETSSGTPMGVIQPTILQRKESLKENMNRNFTMHSEETAGDVNNSDIKTMEDVPNRTSSLTVEDVSACLQLLNMDVHISEFKKNQVDGNTLGDLKEQTLMNEFHFTPFNASKLMRFSRGWRPKLT